jgi:hypothetical protein
MDRPVRTWSTHLIAHLITTGTLILNAVSIRMLPLTVLKVLIGTASNVSPMEGPTLYAELAITGMAILASSSVIHPTLLALAIGSGTGLLALSTLDPIIVLVDTTGTLRSPVVFIRHHRPLVRQIISGTVKTVYPLIRHRLLSTVCPVTYITSFLVVVSFSVRPLLLVLPVTYGTELPALVQVAL